MVPSIYLFICVTQHEASNSFDEVWKSWMLSSRVNYWKCFLFIISFSECGCFTFQIISLDVSLTKYNHYFLRCVFVSIRFLIVILILILKTVKCITVDCCKWMSTINLQLPYVNAMKRIYMLIKWSFLQYHLFMLNSTLTRKFCSYL